MSSFQHIYWFAPYNLTCPSTRYRGLLPLQQAQESTALGYDFFYPEHSISTYCRFLLLFFRILFFRKEKSLIVVQKVCSQRVYAHVLKWLIRLRPQATLYDLDDAEYYRQPTNTLHFFLRHCQWVQVGSQALANYALAFNTNVFVNTSPVPAYHTNTVTKKELFTVGWVGDFGNGKAISKAFAHKTSLFNLLFPVLKELDFPIKLILIGIKQQEDIPLVQHYFEDFPQVQLDIPIALDWTNDAWLYPYICQFDVGVSPLVAHPFNTAKSAFKAKQYLACGVPVVASAVGENAAYIYHGQNGWLCTSSEDWKTALTHFKTMSQERYSQYVCAALAGRDRFSIMGYVERLLAASQLALREG
jgi:glycosyltransferase involved in cell wall biosynthesis